MIQWEMATVGAPAGGWPGVERWWAHLASGGEIRVLSYPALVGPLREGDRVVVNMTALRRGLGTGGDGLVAAVPDRLVDPAPGPGHMVKSRYTPMQTMVMSVDDPASPHHETLAAADAIDGMPVVVADLHSSLPAVVAGIRSERPGARVVYVLDDGAALPAWYSRTVAGLRESGWLEACISSGQAFGGDLDAVTVHSALLAARHVVHADIAVVTQGPGNLGSGTPFGFSGLRAAEAVHATAALGGRSVGVLRVSGADPRPRHRGVSHHSATVFGRAVLAPVLLASLSPADTECDPEFSSGLAEQVDSMVTTAAARGVRLDVRRAEAGSARRLTAALEDCPVPLSTMGRSLRDDPWAFVFAAAAGALAARESDSGEVPLP